MHLSIKHTSSAIAFSLLAGSAAHAANPAFDGLDHWWASATATPGDSSSQGGPSILTWSIVPDGTPTDTSGTLTHTSTLIAALNSQLGSSSGSDLTTRPWFSLFETAYGRWGELSGLTFIYEPKDGGTKHGSGGQYGKLNKRGDMRIAGASIDGNTGRNTLAYNYFPNNGDMLIDVDNKGSWELYDPSKPVGGSNDPFLINILEHEIGHGLGLPHLESNDSKQLLEPTLDTSFYGPQMDDILMIQRLYGDAFEAGSGNDTTSSAQQLGAITAGTTWSIGGDADRSRYTKVEGWEKDFVTIDDNGDLDVYAFSLSESVELDIALTPEGISYNQGEEDSNSQSVLNMQALSDLSFEIMNSLGTVLASFDSNTIGFGESVNGFAADAGDYFIRVRGEHDNAQFYKLAMTVNAIPEPNALAVIGLMLMLTARREHRSAK